MKELSIEEKAKRYDEAIERANELCYVNDKDSLQRKTVEHIFPQLKESEDENADEKVRKALINLVTNHASMDLFIEYDIHLDEALAWLEKQGEQKPVVDTKVIIPKFRVGDIVKSKSQPMLSSRKIISIGKDCYWCEDRGCIGFAWEDDCEIVEQKPDNDLPKGEDYGIDGLWHAERILEKTLGEVEGYQSDDGILEHKCAISSIKELKKMKQQNWSEEDEKTINNICHIIRQYDKISKKENQPCWYIGDCLLWMQNIKNKVIPQSRQDWSEEDEKILNYLLWFYDTRFRWNDTCNDDIKFGDIVTFLKSLKDRVQPKQEWSDEEQQIIKDAACFILSCVNTAETKEEEERLEGLADKLQDIRPQSQWKSNDISEKDVDLEEEIKKVQRNYKTIEEYKGYPCTMYANSVEWIARHFFELGISSNLDLKH